MRAVDKVFYPRDTGWALELAMRSGPPVMECRTSWTRVPAKRGKPDSHGPTARVHQQNTYKLIINSE